MFRLWLSLTNSQTGLRCEQCIASDEVVHHSSNLGMGDSELGYSIDRSPVTLPFMINKLVAQHRSSWHFLHGVIAPVSCDCRRCGPVRRAG